MALNAQRRLVRGRRGERGVTMLELSFAIFVLLFGVMGIISMYPSAIDMANRSLDISDGAMVAKYAKYEMLLNRSKIDWPPRSEATDPSNDAPRREGRISEVNLTTQVTCLSLDGANPSFPTGPAPKATFSCMSGVTDLWASHPSWPYYLLITSGKAKGRIYPITTTLGSGRVNTTTDGKIINMGADGVIRGDTYRIIGSGYSMINDNTYSSTFPRRYGRGGVGAAGDPLAGHSSTTIASNHAVRDVFRTGDYDPKNDPLSVPYCYAAVISPPDQGAGGACRVDFFCYLASRYKGTDAVYKNPKPFAWHVSHIRLY
jgi:hypothetical protein